MYIVLLKFTENKIRAPEFMNDHRAWILRGIEDGVFVFAGTMKSGLGGAIIANNAPLPDLQARLESDPFVINRIVTPEVLDIAAGPRDARLEFLAD